MFNRDNRSVMLVYSDCLRRASPSRFLTLVLYSFVVGFAGKVAEAVITVLIETPNIRKLIEDQVLMVTLSTALLDKVWVLAVVTCIALVVLLWRDHKRFFLQVFELESSLEPNFSGSVSAVRSLVGEMAHRSQHSTEDEEKARIRLRVEPKIFSALDYCRNVVRKSPPAIDLDSNYINDVHESKSSIFTLWTEEPSTWLDPMLQFYLTNLGIKSVVEFEKALRSHPFSIHDRSSQAYTLFQQSYDGLWNSISGQKQQRSGFVMVRIMLLSSSWLEHYKDELALLVASCELFHHPCLLINRDALITYLAANTDLCNRLGHAVDDLKHLVRSGFGTEQSRWIESRLSCSNDELNLMGMLIIDGSKFYVFVNDDDCPFKSVEDPTGVSKSIIDLLIWAYHHEKSVREVINSPNYYVNRQNSVVGSA